ncbi:TPA: IS3 family transposase [Bacillus cereus]|nr:IS3 family transposase [Bacillus cereus]
MYNHKRIKGRLKGMSLVEYRTHALKVILFLFFL